MQEILENISAINWKTAVPHGTQTRIAKKHKVTATYVNKVVMGKRHNMEILKDMLKEALRYKEEQEEKVSELNSMVNKLM